MQNAESGRQYQGWPGVDAPIVRHNEGGMTGSGQDIGIDRSIASPVPFAKDAICPRLSEPLEAALPAY